MDPGATDEQRNPYGGFEMDNFPPEPVDSSHLTVVTRVDHDRIFKMACRMETVQQLADAVVHEIHTGIVGLTRSLGFFRGQIPPGFPLECQAPGPDVRGERIGTPG